MTTTVVAPLSLGEAEELLAERWGLRGEVAPLGSHEDLNVVVTGPAGRHVLKVTSPATRPAEVEAQALGLARLAATGLPFATPRTVPTLDRAPAVALETAGGVHLARVLTWVDGRPLTGWRHLAPPVRHALGTVAGRTAAALADLSHPALDRPFTWDCRCAADVVRSLAGSVRADRRTLVLEVVDRTDEALGRLRDDLRTATIHGDVTDLNVVARPGDDGRPVPCGLIDVGDLSTGWVVAEAAVAACSAVPHDLDRVLDAVVDVLQGFDSVHPLADAEVEAAWWVVLARAAVLATTTEHQATIDPGNTYVTGAIEREWSALGALVAVRPAVAHQALRLALGREPAPSPALPAVQRSLLVEPVGPVIDLSTSSDQLAPGIWADRRAVGVAIAGFGVGAVGPQGEGRLVAPHPVQDEPATVSLGTEVLTATGAAVLAPFPLVVRRADEGNLPGDEGVIVLAPLSAPTDVGDAAPQATADLQVVLRGVEPTVSVGGTVAAGALIGRVRPGPGTWPTHLHVVVAPTGLIPPRLVPGSQAQAWLALCPDPSPLLGLAPGEAVATRPDAAALQARRDAVLAGVQEHYWEVPPSIERGWGTRLYDTDGRPYLDAVNNVAVLGHSHPSVTDAVTRQLRRLNTNSRFHYESIVTYAERLAALLPDPLDTVFLVSTGSEACDLALRLVRTATGRDDVLALRGAYHGWTMGTDAVSTSLFDNPGALGSRPPWVHLVDAPNTYRGAHRGADAGERYAADVGRAIDELRAAGRAPAGIISEPLSGNAGGIVLPPGYLAGAYERVRAVGGLCIADEVQTGLGRLGDWFWAFESQGVVPDVVTVAKATGNGVPVGAVVTTRAIAEAFGAEGSFFSSVGGSPVSAVAGIAVLDALEAEDLPGNARRVGAHLWARLERLVDAFPLCGAVHGLGLYLGLELVRDGDPHVPAGEEAAAICERARELGVILQPTGDGANVLKIKPPLCLTVADADHLVDVLERILTDGW